MDNGLHDHRAIMVALTRRVILISEDAICRHRPHLHRTTITSTRHVHSPLQPSRPGLSTGNVSKLRYSGGSVGQAFLTGHHMTSTAAGALICLLTHSSKLSSNRMVMATRLLTGRDSLANLPTTAAVMSLCSCYTTCILQLPSPRPRPSTRLNTATSLPASYRSPFAARGELANLTQLYV